MLCSKKAYVKCKSPCQNLCACRISWRRMERRNHASSAGVISYCVIALSSFGKFSLYFSHVSYVSGFGGLHHVIKLTLHGTLNLKYRSKNSGLEFRRNSKEWTPYLNVRRMAEFSSSAVRTRLVWYLIDRRLSQL